jgi:DNA recombination protein RmuC
MEIILLSILLFLSALLIFLFIRKSEKTATETKLLEVPFRQLESAFREELRMSREELSRQNKDNREELNHTLRESRKETNEAIEKLSRDNQMAIEKLALRLDERLLMIIEKNEMQLRQNREDLVKGLKDFGESSEHRSERMNKLIEEKLLTIHDQLRTDGFQMRDSLVKSLREFQDTFDKNVKSFNELQREKFNDLEKRQQELVVNTEKKLEQVRETVDEKLQKTLNERIGQSFDTVGKQLMAVQEGLGEMKTLAQDVGGLKKVLSNVKQRGGVGEIQLEMLLDQILAPDQYEKNVITKQGSSDLVEFAVKLPGKDEERSVMYLPIDAKFPKDAYDQLVCAYEQNDSALIEAANRNIENVIKKMARDIRDKYLDPPNTTDFGIMFLPFEAIYAEVVRRSHLLEQLLREFKVVVTGPATLAAILNSLQVGFRTLALQKRSSEVWAILGAVKNEFEKFGGMLEKAQKNIDSAGNTINELMGKRTKAINRKLREVQSLPENSGLLQIDDDHDDEA